MKRALLLLFVLLLTASTVAADPYADTVVSAGCYGAPVAMSCGPAAAIPLVTGTPDSPPLTNFIQLSAGSEITMAFVDNIAFLSGDDAPDIRIYTFDELFPAFADVLVSADGITWYFVGNYGDTPASLEINIDLDAFAVPVPFIRFVRLVETAEDPAFPLLGFDLDAVEALFMEAQAEGCTYTQGYWKNHDWATPGGEDSWFTLETLWTPPKKGDAWYILSHQYMAAVLNIENGAAVPPEVADALADADTLLGTDPYFIGPKHTDRAEALSLAETLNDFNQGLLGIEHCE